LTSGREVKTDMTLYLLKGFLQYAATTLADAQALMGALADPSIEANAATIDRVTDKIETLVQSDSGETLTLVSIDDTAGSISSWVTDAGTTVTVGLGFTDATTTSSYAGATTLSIAGSTRTGTLALNGTALRDALFYYGRKGCLRLTLQVRMTVSGVTETVALLPVTVSAGVLSSTFV
jgi:hypothetical protein